MELLDSFLNTQDNTPQIGGSVKNNSSFSKTKHGYIYNINSEYIESILTYESIYNINKLQKDSWKYIDPEDHRKTVVIKFKNLEPEEVNSILINCYRLPIKYLEPIDIKIHKLILHAESQDKYTTVASTDLMIGNKIRIIPINQDIPEETQFMFNSEKIIKTDTDNVKNMVEKLEVVTTVLNENLEPPSSLKIIPYNRRGLITSLRPGEIISGKAFVKKSTPYTDNFSRNRINHFERNLDNILLVETRLNDSPEKLFRDMAEYYLLNKSCVKTDVLRDIKNIFTEEFIYPRVYLSEEYRKIKL